MKITIPVLMALELTQTALLDQKTEANRVPRVQNQRGDKQKEK